MLALMIFLSCVFVALAAAIMAGVSDVRTLTIPNLYCAVIAVSFFICYALLWLLGRDVVFAPFLSHFLSGLIVFLMTGALFYLRLIGGGDAKLATAIAFWTGLRGLMPFLFYMAVIGAVLGGAALLLRRYKPVAAPSAGGWIARVQQGESKVPYGVAITAGMLAAFIKIGYLSIDTLAAFLLTQS